MFSDPIPMAGLIQISARNDELNRSVFLRSKALGTELADEWKTQMGLLMRDVLLITPPSSGRNVTGAKAVEQGQAAINRDLSLMGFVPVRIKGHRIISHVPAGNVKGRQAVPIKPVSVRTYINPKFADPDAFHSARIRRLHGGRPTRGGAQPFFVAIGKYKAMKARLFKEIGTLAAPWLPAIRALFDGALPSWVPGFVKRHEGDVAGRSRYSMNFDPSKGALYVRIVNSMPDSANAQAAETQRRVEAAKLYRINAIRRGLEGRAKRISRSFNH